MMPLAEVLKSAVGPALALLPLKMDTPAARVMLLAIGLQESGFRARQQANNGPAHGFWQFELGGVRGALGHPSVKDISAAFCAACHVAYAPIPVYADLVINDILAAGMARLLLYTDALALPAMTDVRGGWEYYYRNWRPGKPRPSDWDANHSAAYAAVTLGSIANG